MTKFLKENLLLLAVIFMALVFRFTMITSLPGGLFPDEAANGLDVNSILHGHVQPFYERGNGREKLFSYILVFSSLAVQLLLLAAAISLVALNA